MSPIRACALARLPAVLWRRECLEAKTECSDKNTPRRRRKKKACIESGACVYYHFSNKQAWKPGHTYTVQRLFDIHIIQGTPLYVRMHACIVCRLCGLRLSSPLLSSPLLSPPLPCPALPPTPIAGREKYGDTKEERGGEERERERDHVSVYLVVSGHSVRVMRALLHMTAATS